MEEVETDVTYCVVEAVGKMLFLFILGYPRVTPPFEVVSNALINSCSIVL